MPGYHHYLYCSGHNVASDDFELTGKEFNDSVVDVSRLNEMKVNNLGCCGTLLMLNRSKSALLGMKQ